MLQLPITAMTAAILAVVYVALAVLIIRLRFRLQVGLGDGGQPMLQRAIRMHGNFAEYVPFMLLLLLLCEVQQVGTHWLYVLAGLTVFGRLSHALGLWLRSGTSLPRFLGMISTFAVLLMAAGLLFVTVI
jgi:uncharacterized membrane protein YecN with MAPEG domain